MELKLGDRVFIEVTLKRQLGDNRPNIEKGWEVVGKRGSMYVEVDEIKVKA